MKQDGYTIVLKAVLVDDRDNLFFYQITGDENWKKSFLNQKAKYSIVNSSGDIIYTMPWYHGKSCNICVNDVTKKLFFNLNEHEKNASISSNYWKTLSEITGDKNWLTKYIKK